MPDVKRIVIPRCIGCGAMHEFERCEGGCREEHLELVAAGDLELIEAAARAAGARIDVALPALREIGERRPQAGRWQPEYRAAAAAARQVLHDAGQAAPWPAGEPQRISVWRCPECGAVDAPQECLGICIWRRFEWVRADEFTTCLEAAERTRELERRSFGLLGRIAHTTPRADGWERSWRALSDEARQLVRDSTQSPRQEAHV